MASPIASWKRRLQPLFQAHPHFPLGPPERPALWNPASTIA